MDKSCVNNNRQQYSNRVLRCCGTDRFHIVCQWSQANSCTCMICLEGLRDTFLLLYMDYCSTSAELEHNDMNIVSDYRQNNRNTLNRQISRHWRKLCYRKDDRAMRAIEVDRMSRCGDMAIWNYPRWLAAANLDMR